MLYQTPWLFLDTQSPEQVAGVMVGDFTVVGSIHILDFENIHQKLTQFKGSLSHLFCPFDPRGIVFKQVFIMVFHHVDTRSRRADNPFGVFKNFNESFGGDPGSFPMACVKGGLAATGLVPGTIHLDAESFENCQHGLSHFRIETIH